MHWVGFFILEIYVKDPHVPVLPNSNVGRRLSEEMVIHDLQSSPGIVEKRWPRQIERAIHNAMFIAQHIDNKDDFESVRHSACLFVCLLVCLFLSYQELVFLKLTTMMMMMTCMEEKAQKEIKYMYRNSL